MRWTGTNAGTGTSWHGTPSFSDGAPNRISPPPQPWRRLIRMSPRGRVPAADHFFHANEQRVRDGDVVIWFNFRADRARQLSDSFSEQGFPDLIARSRPRCIMSPSLNTTRHTAARWSSSRSRWTISSAKSSARRACAQLRIAETEKYPHVTYFFNGGMEKQYPGEDRDHCAVAQGRADLRLQAGDERA